MSSCLEKPSAFGSPETLPLTFLVPKNHDGKCSIDEHDGSAINLVRIQRRRFHFVLTSDSTGPEYSLVLKPLSLFRNDRVD